MKRRNLIIALSLAIVAVAAMFDPSLLHHGLGVMGLAFMGNVTLSPSNVRVVDPVLTNVAQGYMQAEHVGSNLFPRVPVGLRGGQIIEFGKESFQLFSARRAPGAATKRVRFGYLGKPFALLQDSLEAQVPREYLQDAAKMPGIDLGSRAVRMGMSTLSLTLENDQATLARTAANYDGAHQIDLTAAKWNVDANKPTNDIVNGREAIRGSVGIYPNMLLLSAKAFNAIINNANVLDRFKYTSRDSVTPEMLANLWNISKVVVGSAVYFDDTGTAVDIWGTDAILAYVPLTPSTLEQPSFGYTYTLEGNPLVEQPYYDNNAKSWIYPVTYERVPVLSGITSGYLFRNVA